ncbi:uncharacterized protein E0L32_001941 [Thyridium curvatum]|uniref:AAA+ ATPase domain-containing protein n=1 Tax=Thyridium curvatum TaxID=1093900 RepID=A0A507AKY0_9PEZI|nr:uncharacterized protein E0L32_001738 [Thyridium curvatum]XP_030990077.1 uncharacterized protein E0L32_001941 [Thyridium curvatum]TPX08163.1 hypothetical protein E0L32_001738 [Thyridium curvatum]TPX08366.1 hypothetical protein E0L32_001941 [Thyridium curvatum]
MTTLLRPSTRQVARLASLSFRTTARPSIGISRLPRSRLPACAHQIPRYYSSESPNNNKKPESNSSKNKKDAEDKNKEVNGATKKEEEPSGEDGKVNASEVKEDTKDPLPPGCVYLSDQEIKALMEMLSRVPPAQTKYVGEVIQDIKKYGAPVELRELLLKFKDQGLSVADTMKVLRTTQLLAQRLNEAKKGKATDDMFDSNEPRNPFASGQQQQQQQGSEQGRQGKGGPNNKDNQGRPRVFDGSDFMTWVVGAMLLYPLYSMIFPGESSREITWQELRRNFLDKGLVEKLVVIKDRVRVELNREATQQMYPDSVAANPNFHYYFTIGSVDAFERRVEEAQDELNIPPSERIPVAYMTEGVIGSFLLAFGPTLMIVGLLYWMSRRAGGGMGGGSSGVFGFGKSKAKRFNHESAVKVKFADVAGMDEAKLEIMEFVSFLKTPEKFQRLGAKIPRGAILAGPPGTGKTLLAKATAGESGVPFFSVSGSEFVEMFVGVGASRVRDLFATARKNSPCIIFIDEIDAIGKSRSDGSRFGGNEEREATLNQILTEMDGFNTSEQVVVLAGTNRPDILDKALMRPGRFDRHINIDRPTMKGRQDIFKVHLKKITTNEDLEYLTGRLAALTPGFAGADIANAVNEAALIAARANATSVEMIHFEQAIERVIGGLERKSLVLNPEEKRTVAYHEAGHAICGWYFKYADPLLKVSIIPRGSGALGYAQYLPQGDAYLMTVNQLMDRMAMTLGGRISEEIHFPTVTSGASDDFRKVTRMATTMVTEWGMSEKLGPLHFKRDQNELQKPFAESTAQVIDSEVRRIVDEAYKQCKDLLLAKKKEVGIVAEELLRKEMLTRDDMVRLLGPRPFADNDEFTKFFNNEGGGKSAPPPFPTENTDESVKGPQPAVFQGRGEEAR